MRFLIACFVVAVTSAALPQSSNEFHSRYGEPDLERFQARPGISVTVEYGSDRSVPTSVSEFDELLDSLTEHLRQGKAVVVHCWGGVGRSSVIAACALIRNGLSADSVFRVIEESRGRQVPDTAEQRHCVERYSSRFGSVGK